MLQQKQRESAAASKQATLDAQPEPESDLEYEARNTNLSEHVQGGANGPNMYGANPFPGMGDSQTYSQSPQP
jgi:hypothetical protein